MYQNVFKRYELKYIITKEQKRYLLDLCAPYIKADKYGHSTVRNIYYDTDNYRLIRRSLEKPMYKEKIRLRSYSKADENGIVFAELKKKYDSVVYKRRLAVSIENGEKWLCGEGESPVINQISKEIDYFIGYYQGLKPKVFLSYEREAYYLNNDMNFRITFDENILFRKDRLSLCEDVFGQALISSDFVLMELKTAGGIPLWLTHILSEQKIYKTAFSKYGNAYQKLYLTEKNKNGLNI